MTHGVYSQKQQKERWVLSCHSGWLRISVLGQKFCSSHITSKPHRLPLQNRFQAQGFPVYIQWDRDFSGGPVIKNPLAKAGAWVRSLVRELNPTCNNQRSLNTGQKTQHSGIIHAQSSTLTSQRPNKNPVNANVSVIIKGNLCMLYLSSGKKSQKRIKFLGGKKMNLGSLLAHVHSSLSKK